MTTVAGKTGWQRRHARMIATHLIFPTIRGQRVAGSIRRPPAFTPPRPSSLTTAALTFSIRVTHPCRFERDAARRGSARGASQRAPKTDPQDIRQAHPHSEPRALPWRAITPGSPMRRDRCSSFRRATLPNTSYSIWLSSPRTAFSIYDDINQRKIPGIEEFADD